jgi:hypothetical protein
MAITRDQLQIIIDRALARGETAPSAEDLIDRVVAPTIYRIIYGKTAPSLERVHRWVDGCLADANSLMAHD